MQQRARSVLRHGRVLLSARYRGLRVYTRAKWKLLERIVNRPCRLVGVSNCCRQWSGQTVCTLSLVYINRLGRLKITQRRSNEKRLGTTTDQADIAELVVMHERS